MFLMPVASSQRWWFWSRCGVCFWECATYYHQRILGPKVRTSKEGRQNCEFSIFLICSTVIFNAIWRPNTILLCCLAEPVIIYHILPCLCIAGNMNKPVFPLLDSRAFLSRLVIFFAYFRKKSKFKSSFPTQTVAFT